MKLTDILIESDNTLKKFQENSSITGSIKVPEKIKQYFNNLGIALEITKDVTGPEFYDLTQRMGFNSIYNSAESTFEDFLKSNKTDEGLYCNSESTEQSRRIIQCAIKKLEKHPELNPRYSHLEEKSFTDPTNDLRGQLDLTISEQGQYLHIEAVSETTNPLTERDFYEIGSMYTSPGNGGLLARSAVKQDGSSGSFVNAMDVPYQFKDKVLATFKQKGWNIK